MTREGYDTDHLIDLLRRFRAKYPNLEVILEPGSAFTWRTGELIATVLDVVGEPRSENGNYRRLVCMPHARLP